MSTSSHAQITRQALALTQKREADVIRRTYTHKVFYKAQTERCYLGPKAECERFAVECGNCRLEKLTAIEIETEALRVERWRPYGVAL